MARRRQWSMQGWRDEAGETHRRVAAVAEHGQPFQANICGVAVARCPALEAQMLVRPLRRLVYDAGMGLALGTLGPMDDVLPIGA